MRTFSVMQGGSVLLGMGQLLYCRAGAESTSQNKVTASKNYMFGLHRHAVPNLLNKTRQKLRHLAQVTKVGSQVKSRRWGEVTFKSCSSPSQVILNSRV